MTAATAATGAAHATAGGERKMTLEVMRYRPEREAAPSFQAYEVPFREDWVILDALNWIKDNVDGTLSFRWSCRMGVCGSCGMNVNGVPRLTCATFLKEYYPNAARVEPLSNFPVVRDLVIEMDDFLEKLTAVKPWILRKEPEKPVSEGEYRQTPTQLESYKQFSACINCMLCYAACPVYGIEPDFIGPAAIALAHRYNLDSRDEGAAERMKVIGSKSGVWKCTFVGECSEVCPKKVDPAAAIQRSKVAAVNDWALSLLMPKRGGEAK
jgi:fumarate reductase iron-sulfur subunit